MRGLYHLFGREEAHQITIRDVPLVFLSVVCTETENYTRGEDEMNNDESKDSGRKRNDKNMN